MCRHSLRAPELVLAGPVSVQSPCTLAPAAGTHISAGRDRRRLVELTHHDYIRAMTLRERWVALSRIPAVRTALFVAGIVLIAGSPVVGAIPGPGGIIVFAAGLALVLKNSEWAKRQYVRFKRSHPIKGRWADWGLRRRSALRREALMKERMAAEEAAGFGPVQEEADAPALDIGLDTRTATTVRTVEGDAGLERARR